MKFENYKQKFETKISTIKALWYAAKPNVKQYRKTKFDLQACYALRWSVKFENKKNCSSLMSKNRKRRVLQYNLNIFFVFRRYTRRISLVRWASYRDQTSWNEFISALNFRAKSQTFGFFNCIGKKIQYLFLALTSIGCAHAYRFSNSSITTELHNISKLFKAVVYYAFNFKVICRSSFREQWWTNTIRWSLGDLLGDCFQ